jgi:eukaryotic-like serine/threonine-protein kinase
VTSRLPFGEPVPGDSPLTVIFKYIQEPLPPPQQFALDLPPRFMQVIIKALEKDPAQRFQSALENIISQLPDA